MGDIGTPITETIPAVGSSGTTYATNVNLFLTEVKNRLEAQVPRSALEDGDLYLNGFALQNSDYVGIADQVSAPTTPVNTLQAYGGEIYWISTSGAVQLTSGGAINSTSIGGITGDYGDPNPAEFRFVDADQEYYAYDDFSLGTWANIWARRFDIAAGASSTERVRIEYGGAGSYTLTLPSTTPGSQALIQMDSSGALTASNTVPNAVSFGSTVTSSSIVTGTSFSASVARRIVIPASAATPAGTATMNTDKSWTLSSTVRIEYPVILTSGSVIKSFTAYISKTAGGTATAVLTKIAADGTQTNISTVTNSTAGALSGVALTDTTLNEIVPADGSVYTIAVYSDGTGTMKTVSANVTVTGTV